MEWLGTLSSLAQCENNGPSEAMAPCSGWYLEYVCFAHNWTRRLSSLCSPLTLSRLVTNITRHKADGDENSDEYVTNWAFGYIRPLAHHCQQRQRLPLGDGSNGSLFILARTLCNSRAEGSQRHCSGLFLQRLEHTLPTGL